MCRVPVGFWQPTCDHPPPFACASFRGKVIKRISGRQGGMKIPAGIFNTPQTPLLCGFSVLFFFKGFGVRLSFFLWMRDKRKRRKQAKQWGVERPNRQLLDSVVNFILKLSHMQPYFPTEIFRHHFRRGFFKTHPAGFILNAVWLCNTYRWSGPLSFRGMEVY